MQKEYFMRKLDLHPVKKRKGMKKLRVELKPLEEALEETTPLTKMDDLSSRKQSANLKLPSGTLSRGTPKLAHNKSSVRGSKITTTADALALQKGRRGAAAMTKKAPSGRGRKSCSSKLAKSTAKLADECNSSVNFPRTRAQSRKQQDG